MQYSDIVTDNSFEKMYNRDKKTPKTHPNVRLAFRNTLRKEASEIL